MREREIIDNIDTSFQDLLGGFLISGDGRFADANSHLDEDTLAAFAEGNVSEREATPVVAHLSNCGFCRNITSELVRLDMAFASDTVTPLVAESAPSSVAEVMSSLFAKIFGSSGAEVFAHSEPEEEKEEKKSDSDKKAD